MKTSIQVSELKRMLANEEKMLILDVRSREEYQEKHIPFAGNLPLSIIETNCFVPEPDKIIITICGKGGGRSEQAAHYFRNHFPNTSYFLEGGTFGWE